MLTVKNDSEKLPASWAITNIAHFNFKPSSGTLAPRQSQEVLFTFKPRQLGVFDLTTHLVVNKGALVLPIQLIGRCHGPAIKVKKEGLGLR